MVADIWIQYSFLHRFRIRFHTQRLEGGVATNTLGTDLIGMTVAECIRVVRKAVYQVRGLSRTQILYRVAVLGRKKENLRARVARTQILVCIYIYSRGSRQSAYPPLGKLALFNRYIGYVIFKRRDINTEG